MRALADNIAGAFYKVSHRGVPHKTEWYGLQRSLIQWLKSYLANRRIRAAVNGQTSATHQITTGVPQGRILGLTLLLLYVNDAKDHLPPSVGLAVYADDVTLSKAILNWESAAADTGVLQTAVDSLAT